MREFYSKESYRRTQSLLTKLSWQQGVYNSIRKVVIRSCMRDGCTNDFKTIPSDPKKYCSQVCAAIINSIGRVLSEETKSKIAKSKTTRGVHVRKNKFCLHCSVFLNRYQLKYCSGKCQFDYNYEGWLKSWKNGIFDGAIGIMTKNISGHLRRYVHEKFKNKCSRCGWNKKHPITKKVPLEIEHIDGNSENNKEENLTLLCPNCHALTPFFKNLNRGNGRKWRTDKYIKNSHVDI